MSFRAELKKMTVRELRDCAKACGIQKYSGLRKAELISKLSSCPPCNVKTRRSDKKQLEQKFTRKQLVKVSTKVPGLKINANDTKADIVQKLTSTQKGARIGAMLLGILGSIAAIPVSQVDPNLLAEINPVYKHLGVKKGLLAQIAVQTLFGAGIGALVGKVLGS
jgi:hypothetical protein